MVKIPRTVITPNQAREMLLSNFTLRDFSVLEKLVIDQQDLLKIEGPIKAENCYFEYFEASSINFNQGLVFSDCEFNLCHMMFTYFTGGLTIERCVFHNYLDMQAGGHNTNGKAVLIVDNTFNGFVNYFDCHYESFVTISNNDFREGTNLLGSGVSGIKTIFDIQPVIENNKGELDINGEGDIESQSIYLR